MFSQETKTLLQPSSIDGYAPPALAVKICEPKHYSFTANFGPWTHYQGCGPRQGISIATVSIPETATVIHAEDKLNIDVVGCAQALPTVSVDASGSAIKGAYTWTLTRHMSPVGKHADKDYYSSSSLTVDAKHNKDADKDYYGKFNQTISVKRLNPAYGKGDADQFEVRRGRMFV